MHRAGSFCLRPLNVVEGLRHWNDNSQPSTLLVPSVPYWYHQYLSGTISTISKSWYHQYLTGTISTLLVQSVLEVIF
jgi:hypothetical protein